MNVKACARGRIQTRAENTDISFCPAGNHCVCDGLTLYTHKRLQRSAASVVFGSSRSASYNRLSVAATTSPPRLSRLHSKHTRVTHIHMYVCMHVRVCVRTNGMPPPWWPPTPRVRGRLRRGDGGVSTQQCTHNTNMHIRTRTRMVRTCATGTDARSATEKEKRRREETHPVSVCRVQILYVIPWPTHFVLFCKTVACDNDCTRCTENDVIRDISENNLKMPIDVRIFCVGYYMHSCTRLT